jgi:hypothetical protein
MLMAVPAREVILNRWFFGLQGASLFHMPVGDIATTGTRRLSWQKALGSSWGRNDLWWNQIQPSPGSYKWAQANEVVHTYRKFAVKLLAVMDGFPAWAPSTAPTTEALRTQWSNFVKSVARQYEHLLWGIEVWNEPNTAEFWKAKPDPKAYAELVKRAWNAARTDGTKDIPGPQILAGGTAGYDPVFLNQMLDADIGKYFDVLSFHPYPDDMTESPDKNNFPEILDQAWDLLKRHGLKKRIWVTEMGWPSSPRGVSEDLQANFMVRSHVIGLYKRLYKMFWFNLQDWEKLPWSGEDAAHCGLFDVDFHPKPAACAYNLLQFFMGSTNPRDVTHQGKAVIYSFNVEYQSNKWPGYMHVAWTDTPGAKQFVQLPMVAGGNVFAVDYLGHQVHGTKIREEHSRATQSNTTGTQTSVDDSMTTAIWRFPVDYNPLYIWDAGDKAHHPKTYN